LGRFEPLGSFLGGDSRYIFFQLKERQLTGATTTDLKKSTLCHSVNDSKDKRRQYGRLHSLYFTILKKKLSNYNREIQQNSFQSFLLIKRERNQTGT